MIQDRKITAYSKTHAMLANEPNDTLSADQLKAWWDTAPEEARVAINGIADDIIAYYATKAELSGIQLGQISDGTVTPAKLSFVPATKAELDTHIGATTAHGAVSAPTANTLSIRDANGRSQFTSPAVAADAATKGYVDAIKPFTGTFTGDGTATRNIALPITPSGIILWPRYSNPSNYGGFALNGFPTGDGSNNWILIGTNKFTVYYDSAKSIFTNENGNIYRYVVFP